MNTRIPWHRLAAGLVAVLLLVVAAVPLLARSVHAQAEPSLEVVSPAPGEQVTTDDIEVTVKVTNFSVDCAQSGRPDTGGVGHIHAMIDGMSMAQLANFYCGETFTIPGAGLTPGKHTLIIDLATNTHLDMMATAQQVEIDYQPANPQPLPEANFTGDPGVELINPSDGATVPPRFTVEVKPVNFEPSAELEGKQNVPGYGHWHVFVDTPMGAMDAMDMGGSPETDHAMMDMGTPAAEGAMGGMNGMPMMAMPGMVAMPGTNTFEVDLSAWGPGEHTIFIEPVQNDHTMFQDFGHVEFTVTVDPSLSEGGARATASAVGAAAVTVAMTQQLAFDPPAITIKVGETVTWVNQSPIPHTATDDPAKNPVAGAHPEYAQLPPGAEPWDSGLLDPGQSWSHTFTTPGVYEYFCIPHVLSGMRGTVTVTG